MAEKEDELNMYVIYSKKTGKLIPWKGSIGYVTGDAVSAALCDILNHYGKVGGLVDEFDFTLITVSLPTYVKNWIGDK